MTTQINHAYLDGKLDGIDGLQLMAANDVKSVKRGDWLLRLRWAPDNENPEVYQWAVYVLHAYDNLDTEPDPSRHFLYVIDLGWLVSNEQALSMKLYHVCANDLMSVNGVVSAIARNEYDVKVKGCNVAKFEQRVEDRTSIVYRIDEDSDLWSFLWVASADWLEKAFHVSCEKFEAASAGKS